ncbi:ester cyclase [uncultured Sphingomonas sp.]|uniref:ester cyclase n=1 Tax=uncultured Sphingomonas sp. TaxID=158754 RepID=UPI0035CAFD0B
MSGDRRAWLKRFIAAWHARDLAGVGALLAPGFRYQAATVQADSIEALFAMARIIWAATPDEAVELLDVIVEDDAMAVEVRTLATHTGDLLFGGIVIPASGRALDIRSVWMMRFQGDKLLHWREYGSIKQWVEQMGATVTITPGERP